MLKLLIIITLMVSVGAQAAPKGLQNFFKNKTKIDNPFTLRDPFKPPINKAEAKRKGRGFTITGKGSYSNIGETDFGSLNINTLRVVGVLIGKERRALVNGGGDNKKIIILKEGLKIGPEQAEVKAILPGGIVLVEKIVNVYGEEEYLETVIPISR